ncbi:MAG: replication factor C small subunit [Candidatus Altiarchaeota archaeon]|nr:replication factor C small subunit [Candidatus Altiarchaeota archaeon]
MANFGRIWTEKYRPLKLKDMLNQEHIVSRLRAFVDSGSVPHMLFAGPPGVGKTTAALCMARELFGEHWKDNYMETNASDERGIDVIRHKVKNFARTKPLGGTFKLIFLDEADALTKDAQQALRRTMEVYSTICRFILSCNYPSKVIEPIQSRTVVFRFRPFIPKDMEKILVKVAAGEGVKHEEGALAAIAEIASGDARYSINLFQAASAIGNKLTRATVFEAAARAKPEEVKEMLKLAFQGEFTKARDVLIDLLAKKGISGDLIIREIHKQIVSGDLDDHKRVALMEAVGEHEFRMLEGASEMIQLDSLLAKIAAVMKWKS